MCIRDRNTPEKPESLQKTKKNKSGPSTSPSSAVTSTFAAKLAKVTRLFGRKENVKCGEHKLQGIVKKKATQKRPYVPQIKGMDKIKKYLIPTKESPSPKKKANLKSPTDQLPVASNNSGSGKGKGVGKKSKPLQNPLEDNLGNPNQTKSSLQESLKVKKGKEVKSLEMQNDDEVLFKKPTKPVSSYKKKMPQSSTTAKNSQKTNAYQLSKALLLDDNAEFNSKPELEIYADDVKCSHGSTSGNIDQDSLHYLMTRGLSREDSTKLLICLLYTSDAADE